MGNENARDSGEDLAAWLKDAGRRTWKTDQAAQAEASVDSSEPPEVLIEYLEQMAGRSFLSKDDVQRFVAEISGDRSRAAENAAKGQLVRQTLLLLGLLIAYMQYNFIDVSLQIARLPATIIFVPVTTENASLRGGEIPRRT